MMPVTLMCEVRKIDPTAFGPEVNLLRLRVTSTIPDYNFQGMFHTCELSLLLPASETAGLVPGVPCPATLLFG